MAFFTRTVGGGGGMYGEERLSLKGVFYVYSLALGTLLKD